MNNLDTSGGGGISPRFPVERVNKFSCVAVIFLMIAVIFLFVLIFVLYGLGAQYALNGC